MGRRLWNGLIWLRSRIRRLWKLASLYLWRLLVWGDQGVGVICWPLLNLLVSRGGARFGHPDETLSSVMGKNSRTGTCRVCSWVCRYILHPLDSHHCEKSIEADRGDLSVRERP